MCVKLSLVCACVFVCHMKDVVCEEEEEEKEMEEDNGMVSD